MFNYIKRYDDGTVAYYEDYSEIIVTTWNTKTDEYNVLETFSYDGWKSGDKKAAITMAKGLIDSFCLLNKPEPIKTYWSEAIQRYVTIPND